MSLKSDNYDSSEAVERLVWDARHAVGETGWRVVGPELEGFIRYEVAGALLSAFSKAEALYVREQFDRSEQSSRTLLEGVLAGCKLGRASKEA